MFDIPTLGPRHLDDAEAIGDVLAEVLGNARLDRLLDSAGEPSVSVAVPRCLALAVIPAQRRCGGKRVVRGLLEPGDEPRELAIDPAHDHVDVAVTVEGLVEDDEVDRLELVDHAAFGLRRRLGLQPRAVGGVSLAGAEDRHHLPAPVTAVGGEHDRVLLAFGELGELGTAGFLQDVAYVLERREAAEVRLPSALREDRDGLRTLALETRDLVLPVLKGDVANGAGGVRASAGFEHVAGERVARAKAPAVEMQDHLDRLVGVELVRDEDNRLVLR